MYFSWAGGYFGSLAFVRRFWLRLVHTFFTISSKSGNANKPIAKWRSSSSV